MQQDIKERNVNPDKTEVADKKSEQTFFRILHRSQILFLEHTINF